MQIPFQKFDPGVLPESENFFFAAPLTERECELFYYIPWCGHFYCTEEYCFQRQNYPYCLLIYVQQGTLSVRYREQPFLAVSGDVVLLDCGEPHYYSAHNGLEFYYIHFSGSDAHELCQYYLETEPPLIQSEINWLVRNFLVSTVSFYSEDKYESIMDTSMRVYKALHLIFSHKYMTETPKNTAVDTVQNYIYNHIREKFSLQQMAGLVNLNPYYFSHMFKRETGMSLFEYIINVRINQAKVLLSGSSRPIANIAREVGYESGGSFTNVFTKKTGYSPSQFRKMVREEKSLGPQEPW